MLEKNVYMIATREKPFTWTPYKKPLIDQNRPINHKRVLIVDMPFL